MKWAIATVLLLLSCDGSTSTSSAQVQDFTTNLIYVRDPRVNLCFAVKSFNTADLFVVQAFTEVPCDKAEKLLRGTAW